MGTYAMTDWYRSTPIRRAQPNPIPKEPPTLKGLFSGLFRTRMAERSLNDLQAQLAKLDDTLAKENFLAVTAAHYQLAVEAALRIKRPDLIREFEQERDKAILAARSAKPLRKRTPR